MDANTTTTAASTLPPPKKPRSALYKRKKRSHKRRSSRVCRLKTSLKIKEQEILQLESTQESLKTMVRKSKIENKSLKKTLRDTELENLVLKDPNSRSYRMHQLGLSATLASSGCKVYGSGSLLPSVKLIAERDILSVPKEIGSGRFGTCFMHLYAHFQVCVKVLKHSDSVSLCTEANITSKFCSSYLPYLIGVCLSKHAIVTTFHGLGDVSVTLHQALYGKSRELLDQYDLKWMNIIEKILSGIEELHSRHKILHNDLKSDNIVLTASLDKVVKPVIIDFGKACEIVQGRLYRLTLVEREQYKLNHPQIAPDVRDGLCKQSEASDIYSYGRIVSMVSRKTKEITVQNLSKMCMMYNANDRPLISSIKTLFANRD